MVFKHILKADVQVKDQKFSERKPKSLMKWLTLSDDSLVREVVCSILDVLSFEGRSQKLHGGALSCVIQ